jgi:hypothetical protein
MTPRSSARKTPPKKTSFQRQPAQPPNVKVGVPHMPALYIGKMRKGFLPWSHAETRLVRSRSYWICTTRPDRRPHSIPVWGMWVEGAFYFGTARETRKSKNIAHNPAVSVHLESGDDVVILEGNAVEADLSDNKLRSKLDAESQRKYSMPLMIMPETVCYRVRPRVVLAWTEKEFPTISTRWEFPD